MSTYVAPFQLQSHTLFCAQWNIVPVEEGRYQITSLFNNSVLAVGDGFRVALVEDARLIKPWSITMMQDEQSMFWQ